MSGLTADARTLVEHGRVETQVVIFLVHSYWPTLKCESHDVFPLTRVLRFDPIWVIESKSELKWLRDMSCAMVSVQHSAIFAMVCFVHLESSPAINPNMVQEFNLEFLDVR
jgi:hypothetical protein